jgi:hypothetical protein
VRDRPGSSNTTCIYCTISFINLVGLGLLLFFWRTGELYDEVNTLSKISENTSLLVVLLYIIALWFFLSLAGITYVLLRCSIPYLKHNRSIFVLLAPEAFRRDLREREEFTKRDCSRACIIACTFWRWLEFLFYQLIYVVEMGIRGIPVRWGSQSSGRDSDRGNLNQRSFSLNKRTGRFRTVSQERSHSQRGS